MNRTAKSLDQPANILFGLFALLACHGGRCGKNAAIDSALVDHCGHQPLKLIVADALVHGTS